MANMRRGRLQSLYRYMPDQTYNWEKGLGSFRGTHDVDARPLDIPNEWVQRDLLRLLRGYAIPAIRGQTFIHRGEYDLLEPIRLRGEFYPRVFQCPDPQCGAVIEAKDESPDRVRCPLDGQRMSQLAFVEYHRCGHLEGLTPPACPNGCRQSMQLVGPTGKARAAEDRRIAEWRWRCSRCGVKPRGVYRGCPSCGKGQVRVALADAGPVYYAQSITVINPPRKRHWGLLSADGVYRAAIAQGLGLFEPGMEGLQQAINDSGALTEEEIKSQIIEKYRLDPGDPKAMEFAEYIASQHQSQSSWRDEVDALGLAEEDLEDLGSECVNLSLILGADEGTSEKRPLSTELLVRNTEGAMKAKYEVGYRKALDQLGLLEVHLIREFPIARIIAGYTREDPKPASNPDDSPTFQFYAGEGGRKAMYGQRSVTEALLFRVDPARVVEWLQRSDPQLAGDIAVPPAAWLYKTLTPVGSIFEEPEDRITAAVLGLLHSMSHRIMLALASHSGLKAESLTEKLLPYNCAFVIYPGGRSEFILGGLEHVFRNYLDECLEEATREARCVFDPPCTNRTGACAVCMYLSEVSCERFNTALSRHYLWGGTSRGVTWSRFWQKRSS